MTQKIDRAWLSRFAQAVRVLTLNAFENQNTCIVTTRVGLAVLDHYGVKARPLSVRASADNEQAARSRYANLPPEKWDPASWTVVIDPTLPNQKGAWNGHLVIIVRSDEEHDFDAARVLIDLTADQFDRPEKGIDIGGPIIFGIPSGQPFTPVDPLGTKSGGPGTGLPFSSIMYFPLAPGSPRASEWREASDWTLPEEFIDEAVRRIIEEIDRGAEQPGQ